MSRPRHDRPDSGPSKRANPDRSGHPPDGPLDGGFTAAQAKGVDALAGEPVFARAAEAAGVNERTLRRWWREPAFRRAVQRARRESYELAVGLTQRAAPVAVAALVKLTQDAGTPPASKVSAATALLRFGRESIELDDLAARVEALEGQAAAATAAATPPPHPAQPEDER